MHLKHVLELVLLCIVQMMYFRDTLQKIGECLGRRRLRLREPVGFADYYLSIYVDIIQLVLPT